MTTLAEASLRRTERRVLDRLVPLMQAEFGSDLHGIWLYGSRARGEPPAPESDVDLLVVARGVSWRDYGRAFRVVDEAARLEGAAPIFFSVKLYDPDELAERRRIRSFFLQEVDRDRIILAGKP
jgi:predicted nucleotidyltransferase